MSDDGFTITGLQETQKTLYAYSQQMGDRVVRMALRRGTNYVLHGIKDAVPVKTGLLKRRGFKVANSRIHNGRRASEMIGVYISLRKKKGNPFYGRFQNDGFQAGTTKVPGKGFVQRVFAERKEAAVQLVVQSAEAGAEAIKRRLGMR